MMRRREVDCVDPVAPYHMRLLQDKLSARMDWKTRLFMAMETLVPHSMDAPITPLW